MTHAWKSKLIVNPELGRVDRVLPSGKVRVDVGSDNGHGYKRINLNGSFECVHRIVWMHVNGDIPSGFEIDHINGNRSDNRIFNLRMVTKTANRQNQTKAQTRSCTGVMGVSKAGSKWAARISMGNKKRHLGCFDTPEQAHSAYLQAKRNNHDGCTI